VAKSASMPSQSDQERWIPLVRGIARGIHRSVAPPLEVDDLLGYGMVGLNTALERYRPETGVGFEAFARYRIRGAILEGIARECPVGRHVWRRLKLEEKANDYMQDVTRDVVAARERTAARDAAIIASTVRDLATIYGMARPTYSGDGEDSRLDFEDPSAHEEAEKHVRGGEIAEFLDDLPDDQADLIRLYYFEDLTLEEVGLRLGFKKSWACKLHRSALRRLREMMMESRAECQSPEP